MIINNTKIDLAREANSYDSSNVNTLAGAISEWDRPDQWFTINSLYITEADEIVAATLITGLANNPNISKLHLNSCVIPDDIIKRLLTACYQINELHIEDSKLNITTLKYIANEAKDKFVRLAFNSLALSVEQVLEIANVALLNKEAVIREIHFPYNFDLEELNEEDKRKLLALKYRASERNTQIFYDSEESELSLYNNIDNKLRYHPNLIANLLEEANKPKNLHNVLTGMLNTCTMRIEYNKTTRLYTEKLGKGFVDILQLARLTDKYKKKVLNNLIINNDDLSGFELEKTNFNSISSPLNHTDQQLINWADALDAIFSTLKNTDQQNKNWADALNGDIVTLTDIKNRIEELLKAVNTGKELGECLQERIDKLREIIRRKYILESSSESRITEAIIKNLNDEIDNVLRTKMRAIYSMMDAGSISRDNALAIVDSYLKVASNLKSINVDHVRSLSKAGIISEHTFFGMLHEALSDFISDEQKYIEVHFSYERICAADFKHIFGKYQPTDELDPNTTYYVPVNLDHQKTITLHNDIYRKCLTMLSHNEFYSLPDPMQQDLHKFMYIVQQSQIFTLSNPKYYALSLLDELLHGIFLLRRIERKLSAQKPLILSTYSTHLLEQAAEDNRTEVSEFNTLLSKELYGTFDLLKSTYNKYKESSKHERSDIDAPVNYNAIYELASYLGFKVAVSNTPFCIFIHGDNSFMLNRMPGISEKPTPTEIYVFMNALEKYQLLEEIQLLPKPISPTGVQPRRPGLINSQRRPSNYSAGTELSSLSSLRSIDLDFDINLAELETNLLAEDKRLNSQSSTPTSASTTSFPFDVDTSTELESLADTGVHEVEQPKSKTILHLMKSELKKMSLSKDADKASYADAVTKSKPQ